MTISEWAGAIDLPTLQVILLFGKLVVLVGQLVVFGFQAMVMGRQAKTVQAQARLQILLLEPWFDRSTLICPAHRGVGFEIFTLPLVNEGGMARNMKIGISGLSSGTGPTSPQSLGLAPHRHSIPTGDGKPIVQEFKFFREDARGLPGHILIEYRNAHGDHKECELQLDMIGEPIGRGEGLGDLLKLVQVQPDRRENAASRRPH